MKFHASVINQLLRIYELHGGRQDNRKLTQALNELDLMPYKQKLNEAKEQFLVMTKDVQAHVDANANKRR